MKLVAVSAVFPDRNRQRRAGPLANHLSDGSEPAVPQLNLALNAFERSIATIDAGDEPAATHLAARLALYRALVATIDGLSSESLNARPQAQRSLSVSGNMFFRSRETQITRRGKTISGQACGTFSRMILRGRRLMLTVIGDRKHGFAGAKKANRKPRRSCDSRLERSEARRSRGN